MATIEEMGKADKKKHNKSSRRSSDLHASASDIEQEGGVPQKTYTHAKYPLWRNGCFVKGGDPKQDVVQVRSL